jgi:hypothetical protein
MFFYSTLFCWKNNILDETPDIPPQIHELIRLYPKRFSSIIAKKQMIRTVYFLLRKDGFP